VPYTLSFINPININVSLIENVTNTSLRIYYHPWWRAYADQEELNVSQDDWFLHVNGLENIESFRLIFNTTYFFIGNLISFVAFLVLVALLYYFK
jgi:hypothetical protein